MLRDLGWDLGEPRFFPNLWFPEDLKFTAFEVVQLEIEELAMLNEDNGGRYLAFSGGVSIFPGAGDPKRVETATTTPAPHTTTPGVPAEGQPNGGGIRFRRLRFRIGGNPEAPQWLLDGVTIFLAIDSFELSGSGTATDSTRDGHRYREFGLGLFIAFHAMEQGLLASAPSSYYGKVSGPVDNFTYWLFGFQLGYCPLGPYELRGISVLVASGMAPALPEPSGRPQEMRLLDWYKANKASGAVEVRSDRTQTRGGWRPEQGATAAGVGFDVGLSVSKNVLLRAFLFMHKSDTEFGFLVAVEVFILKGRKPVGLGAIEVDTRNDKWSALIAVNLDFAKLLDTDSALAKGLGTLDRVDLRRQQAGHVRHRPARRPVDVADARVQQVAARDAGAGLVRRLPADQREARAAGLRLRRLRRGRGQPRRRQGAALRLVRAAHRHVGQRGELVRGDRVGRGRAADQGVLRLLLRRQREGDHRATRPAGAELQAGQSRGAHRDAVVAARRDLPPREGVGHRGAGADAGAVVAAGRGSRDRAGQAHRRSTSPSPRSGEPAPCTRSTRCAPRPTGRSVRTRGRRWCR